MNQMDFTLDVHVKNLCLVIMDCGKKKNNTKNKNHYILLISYWLKNYDIGLHAPV